MISAITVYSDNNYYSTSTQDKVFLLNTEEVNKYFTSNSEMQCKSTAYAKAQGAYASNSNGNCWWWLRSPGSVKSRACRVYIGGSVDCFGASVNCDGGAVRPAMWIDLAAE